MIDHLLKRWEGRPEHAFRDVAAFLSAFAVLFSVAWSFLNYHGRRPVLQRKQSAVDTATMLLFFGLFSWLLARQIGVVRAVPVAVEQAAILFGLTLIVVGCVINVLGRRQLGPTWANQIAIYEQHELVTGGMFHLVRHPLYASIIWMFLGASIAFLNYAALLATLLVFIPAMHLRARQEEKMLLGHFPEYEGYRQRTGAFFPKLFNSRSTIL